MTEATVDLRALARRALDFVPEVAVVGLGTGHAATAFIEALAERVRDGAQVRGVPTSQASAVMAHRLGIPLVTLDEVDAIDVDVDGADEVDPDLNLIKGYGGALVREKIIAAASRRVVILVGEEKLVPVLGSRGKLPVEVVPFALATCLRRFELLGLTGEPRLQGRALYVTDNGNHVVDCRVPALDQPAQLNATLLLIPGVVGTGLFLDMANVVLVDHPAGVEVRERAGGRP